ncbi:hypothetical protein [Saccharothrix sp. ST-888]|uniref:hypothetical protein n=1 Tax=Saccharothrix sp. ST-888 TaxID=1427391 RepID=UPI0006970F64|nr:hypothetical protein [Saccharothrix sp. ST-888]
MSNPYQTPPPDPYGGYGPPQPQQPYGAPQYQQQPQPGYGYPQQPQPQPLQFGAPPVAAQPNTMATASIALGFVAVLASCVYGGFLGLIGLGVGIAGLNRSNTTGVGRTPAIGGIVLNTLAVLISVALVVFYLVISK